MSTLFISYRRESAAGEARALFNELAEKFGKSSVFMDVDSIDLGRDFRSALQQRLDTCDVMIVLIDKDWVASKDGKGRLRLQNANDFVRMEIAAALKRNIVVTPVLVGGADMPAAEELPEDIRDLAYRNGFELAHSRWDSDVEEMIRRLGLQIKTSRRLAFAFPTAKMPFAFLTGKLWERLTARRIFTTLAFAIGLPLVVLMAGLAILQLNPSLIDEPPVAYDDLRQTYDGVWTWSVGGKEMQARHRLVITDIKGDTVIGRGSDQQYGDYTFEGVIREDLIDAKYFSNSNALQPSREGSLVLRIARKGTTVVLDGEWSGVDQYTRMPLNGLVTLASDIPDILRR